MRSRGQRDSGILYLEGGAVEKTGLSKITIRDSKESITSLEIVVDAVEVKQLEVRELDVSEMKMQIGSWNGKCSAHSELDSGYGLTPREIYLSRVAVQGQNMEELTRRSDRQSST